MQNPALFLVYVSENKGMCIPLKGAERWALVFESVTNPAGFPQTLRMKITTQKTGSIWHGYLEAHPEVDERGLTEEVARQKVERIVAALDEKGEGCSFPQQSKRGRLRRL